MPKQLIKGNEAILRGAILAGCRAFYSYPITPASEIGETAAALMPQVGGTFLQAESEVAAVNMLYGAASTGIRSMTRMRGEISRRSAGPRLPRESASCSRRAVVVRVAGSRPAPSRCAVA